MPRPRINESVVPQLPAGTSLASLTTLLTDFGRNLGGPDGNATSWITPDIDAFADLFDIYSNSGLFELSGASNSNARGNIRDVQESDAAGYLQARFQVRRRHPDPRRTSACATFTPTSDRPAINSSQGLHRQVTVRRSYDDWLPALNLTAEVTPDVLLRLGGGKSDDAPLISARSHRAAA